MREMLDRRNCTDVKRVARIGLIRADAALTENEFGLPSFMMYSAAFSHSSMVAASPRFSMTGFPAASDRLQEAEIPLLDEIEKEHAASDIALRDADDKAQIRLLQTMPRFLVARLHR